MDTDPLPAVYACLAQMTEPGVVIPQTFSAAAITALALAFAALFVSAFVSGSEIAFFSLTPSQVEALDETPAGRRAERLLHKPERLLATILIANNLVNVTIVVLCNFALGPVFEGMNEVLSFILQTVILTFLILLFGEILPKLVANSNVMRWVLHASGGLSFLSWLLGPLASLLTRSSYIVNKVVTRHQPEVTTDDLTQALEITDVEAGDDREMLQGILEFGQRTAVEVMTPRVDMTDLPYDSTFEQVMDLVVKSGYSRLPVTGETQDDIKGILYSRDLLPYVGVTPPDDLDWHTLLREPYFVPESRMIDDLLEDFRRRHIHMAVVVDEFGGTQGIVTLEDVLEEIVGDINDEYDEDDTTYKRLPDDTFVFEGRTLLADFFRVTGLNPDDYEEVSADVETLAGMLLAIKGDFPKEKEPMVYGRCRFLILEISNHRITEVRVKVMPENESGQ